LIEYGRAWWYHKLSRAFFSRKKREKRERKKEGSIMKKWKRSLSMLLMIAMLAGN